MYRGYIVFNLHLKKRLSVRVSRFTAIKNSLRLEKKKSTENERLPSCR